MICRATLEDVLRYDERSRLVGGACGRRFGGSGIRRMHRGGGGGGPKTPVNSVAPSLSWNPTIGNSPTVTPGTWTGSPTLTYNLRRDGVDVVGQTGRTLAQINAYVSAAADIKPALTVFEIPNGDTAAGVASNAITFLPEVHISQCTRMLETRTSRGLAADGSTWTDQSSVGAVFTPSTSAPNVNASDAAFNNQRTVTFVAANSDGYVSDKAASTYAAQSNGAGGTHLCLVKLPATAATEVICDNANYGNGCGYVLSTSPSFAFDKRCRALVTNAALATVFDTLLTGPVLTESTKYDIIVDYLEGASPEWNLYLDGALADSGNSAAAPSATPAATVHIGERQAGGSAYFNGTLAIEAAFAKVLSANERASLRAYSDNWYGA